MRSTRRFKNNNHRRQMLRKVGQKLKHRRQSFINNDAASDAEIARAS